MKRTKRSLAVILSFIIVSALLSMPTMASAESLGDMTYAPPAGYTDHAVLGDGLFARYLLPNGSVMDIGHGVGLQHGAQSVHDKTDMEWLDFIEGYYGGREKTFANMLAKFVNINGYEYVKITFGHEKDGTFFYDTAYIGGPNCEYAFFYGDKDESKPYDGTLLAVVESAQYRGASVTPSITPADDTIKIYVNGELMYPDADPVIVNDRTLVPIRVIAEALGYTVSWDGPNQCVTMSKPGIDIQVMIGATSITTYYNGQPQYDYMDVAAEIRNSRTFIPLRAVAEHMGCLVDWDGSTRSVYINSGGEG